MNSETPVGRWLRVVWWCVVLGGLCVRAQGVSAEIQTWDDALARCEAGELEDGARWMLAQEGPPPNGLTGFRATRMLIYAGKPIEALRFAERAAAAYPKNKDARLALALAWVKMGSLEDAKRAVERVNKEDGRAYAMYVVLRYAFLLGQHEGKRAVVRSMLIEADEYPEFLVLAMDFADATNDHEMLAELHARFAKLAPAYDRQTVEQVRAVLALKARFPDRYRREAEARVEWPLESDLLPIVSVSVNGAAPAPFIVDTGASVLVVDQAWAKDVGIESATSMPGFITATGEVTLGLSVAKEVTGPGVRLSNVPVALADLGVLRSAADEAPEGLMTAEGRALLRRVHGLIGGEHLAGDDVMWFDGAGKRLVMARTAEQLAPGRRFRGGFFDGSSLPAIPVALPNKRSLFAILDTGSADTFTIQDAAVSWWGLGNVVVDGGKTVGIAGVVASRGDVAGPLALKLWGASGPITANLPKASLGSAPQSGFHATVSAGLLGWPVLKRFSTAFDYKHRKVLLPVDLGQNSDTQAEAAGPEVK